MCLILIAYDSHPDYRLIMAANRDEFYERPTAPLAFWENEPHILAGRDLKCGGTWMGITQSGTMAAITNFRHPAALIPDAPSRGDLVSDFLKGDQTAASYLEQLENCGITYSGFNLLTLDSKGLFYYSNQDSGVREVSAGIHGLSNHRLDTPWPKVETGKASLRHLLAADDIREETLFDILANNSRPEDHLLPDTGVGLPFEQLLGPMFIESPSYGTRSSSVLLMEKTGRITFSERTFQPVHPRTEKPVTRMFNANFHSPSRDKMNPI
jgi:uncharacterized protein with NRDE domain